MRLLLIGPCFNKNEPSKTGGVIVLFENLIEQCKKRNIDFTVIDTNKANYANILTAMVLIYIKIVIGIVKSAHISHHGTANDFVYISPLVVLLTLILNKKCSLRKFAGNFDLFYRMSHPIKRLIIKLTLKYSYANFFETNYLVKYFKHINKNTYLFPNVRNKAINTRKMGYKKNFVFLGSVNKEKGVMDILEVSNSLDDTYTIHIYGNIADDIRSVDFTKYKAVYKGPLKPEDVLSVLAKYDVLLLPSYREGYPGVIIEALSVGLPLVVSNLDGIKEMVDDKCAVFIRPGNVIDIKNAISGFNSINHSSYSKNALVAFERFDSVTQTSVYLKAIDIYVPEESTSNINRSA